MATIDEKLNSLEVCWVLNLIYRKTMETLSQFRPNWKRQKTPTKVRSSKFSTTTACWHAWRENLYLKASNLDLCCRTALKISVRTKNANVRTRLATNHTPSTLFLDILVLIGLFGGSANRVISKPLRLNKAWDTVAGADSVRFLVFNSVSAQPRPLHTTGDSAPAEPAKTSTDTVISMPMEQMDQMEVQESNYYQNRWRMLFHIWVASLKWSPRMQGQGGSGHHARALSFRQNIWADTILDRGARRATRKVNFCVGVPAWMFSPNALHLVWRHSLLL